MKLKGRTAFVTGASRNIGRAIALAFAAEGADLILNTRANRDELEAVAEECRKHGVRVASVLGDIGDADAVETMVRNGLAVLGAIDVLVCNAAIRPHKSVTETSLEDWHRVFAVNLHSAFYLARAVVPGMKERGRGSIIALGGQSSITGRPGTAAVTAAKTGLLGLVRALAAELGPSGIRVNMGVPAGRPGAAQAHPARPAGPSGGHRGGVPVPGLRRLRVRHGRHDPGHGRQRDRIREREENNVAAQAMVLEFGMGVDVHGDEGTKAACRAVSDAIRHSSLPLFTEVRAKGGRMLVDVTVGVPDPGKIDVERVKKELPHGEVTVRPVQGGLRVPNADTIIACAAITVSVEYPGR